jgi:hypothetical protein
MPTSRTTFIEDSFGSFVEDQTFAIRFVPPTELTIGHHRRAKHALRLVRSALAKIPNCEIEIAEKTLTAKASDARKPGLLNAMEIARRHLELFSAEKITAKAAEEILGITALERQRWTKDGRLPKSGTEFFRRGSSQIQIPTYSRETLVTLYQNLDLLSGWRSADATKIQK